MPEAIYTNSDLTNKTRLCIIKMIKMFVFLRPRLVLCILIETLYECDRAYSANTRNGGKYMKQIRKDLCLFLVLMMLITATPLSAIASAFEDNSVQQTEGI